MSEASEVHVYQPPQALVDGAAVSGMDAYRALCAEAERDYEGYWARLARDSSPMRMPHSRPSAP